MDTVILLMDTVTDQFGIVHYIMFGFKCTVSPHTVFPEKLCIHCIILFMVDMVTFERLRLNAIMGIFPHNL